MIFKGKLITSFFQNFLFSFSIIRTGAVIAAGYMNAVKMLSKSFKDEKIIFLGAGSAGIGVAQAIVNLMKETGMTDLEARRRFWFVDSHVRNLFESFFSIQKFAPFLGSCYHK